MSRKALISWYSIYIEYNTLDGTKPRNNQAPLLLWSLVPKIWLLVFFLILHIQYRKRRYFPHIFVIVIMWLLVCVCLFRGLDGTRWHNVLLCYHFCILFLFKTNHSWLSYTLFARELALWPNDPAVTLHEPLCIVPLNPSFVPDKPSFLCNVEEIRAKKGFHTNNSSQQPILICEQFDKITRCLSFHTPSCVVRLNPKIVPGNTALLV